MENKREYNWSTDNLGNIGGIKKCDVVNETLRDGLQSTSVKDPVVADKIEMLHHMVAIGVQVANLGFPAAHKRQREDVLTLAREISESAMPITPQCAARCQIADLVPIAEIAQETGQSIEVGLFVSVSEIRRQLPQWSQFEICRALENSITFAISKNLSVMFVAEDATRTSPLLLSEVCRTALASGVRRICVADTVGCATPRATTAIIDFVGRLIADEASSGVGIDWHGHRDRGLEIANALAAWSAGADRCHGTVLGVGERCGNAAIETLIVNLHLSGYKHFDLTALATYVGRAALALGVDIPPNQPFFGPNAFRSATGTHVAAIAEALRVGRLDLAGQLFSCINPSALNRELVIEIGPLSGATTVATFLDHHGLECPPGGIALITETAKSCARTLNLEDVRAILNAMDHQIQGRPTDEVGFEVSGTIGCRLP